MNIALSIAALIVAVAFAVLVIFLIQTLISARRTLENIADTLESFEKQMAGLTEETTALLEKTNELAEDIEEKAGRLNPLFEGIKGIGETLQRFNASMKNLTTNLSKGAKSQESAGKAIQWGTTIFDLVRRKKS